MIEKILKFSVQNRYLVILITAIIAAYGFYALTRLPIDVSPILLTIKFKSIRLLPDYLHMKSKNR